MAPASQESSPGPESSPSPVFTPYRLGPLTLRNRIVKAATFEGVMPRGKVTEELVDFHRRVARGGAALTTVAYCAVTRGGRAHPNGLVMRPEVVPHLRVLTDAVHAEGGLAAAQLGHAGLVAFARANRAPTLAPSTRFSPPAMGIVRGANRAQLDQVVGQFRRAASVAVAGGFDALEVHLGHGYLLSSFLSPTLNRRRDDLGGSVENRSRFPRRVLAAVRDEVGDSVAVTAKLGMVDRPDPGGSALADSVEVARLIDADGHLDAIELTAGSSLEDSMYLFRGDVPMQEMVEVQAPVVQLGLKVVGPRMFREYPYEEAYNLPMARHVRDAVGVPLILLGGINRLATMESAIAEGFPLVAMGRALLHDPDLPRKLADGTLDAGRCIHCNRCMPSTYVGTRCVITDPEPVGALHPLDDRRPTTA